MPAQIYRSIASVLTWFVVSARLGRIRSVVLRCDPCDVCDAYVRVLWVAFTGDRERRGREGGERWEKGKENGAQMYFFEKKRSVSETHED